MRRIFAGVILAVLIMAGESHSAERTMRVRQPAYKSMYFHVRKPANLPRDFYVTFDGYLVYKGAKGVWYYASAEKSGLTKTGYVVGSVLPQVVRLKPYNVRISSVAPILGSSRVIEPPKPEESKSDRVVYMPPEIYNQLYNPAVLTPHAQDWTRNSNFMAIGRWQKSVNKMGVLSRSNIPVAWRGNHPAAVYAWTGENWFQLNAKSPHLTAERILRDELHKLITHKNRINRLQWTEDDTHVLAQYAAMWGYEWVGQIIIGREFY